MSAHVTSFLDAVCLILDTGDAFVNNVGKALTRDTSELARGADQFTPLDCAVCHEHHEVAQHLLSRGGVTMSALRDAAAIKIQSFFRGAIIRKTFKRHRALMVKHEKLVAQKRGRGWGGGKSNRVEKDAKKNDKTAAG